MKKISIFYTLLYIFGLVFILVLGFSMCDDGKYYPPCIKSHTIYVPIVNCVGKTCYTTIFPMELCDEYAPTPAEDPRNE